jgi:hypothetical protein
MAEFGNSHTDDGDILREAVIRDDIELVESLSLPQEVEIIPEV